MGLMPSGHGAFVFWSRVVLPPIMQYSQFGTRISFNAPAVLKRGGETDKVSMAQDWGLWCREGYLDFVCPMTYLSSLTFFKRCIVRVRENAAGVKCYPGIGYSVMKPRQDKPAMLAEQVQA